MNNIEEFTYQKENYIKDYLVLILSEDDNYLKGINLNDLESDDLNELLSLHEKYKSKIKECSKKYFKQFKKDKILIDKGEVNEG